MSFLTTNAVWCMSITLDQINAAFRSHVNTAQMSIVKGGDFKAAKDISVKAFSRRLRRLNPGNPCNSRLTPFINRSRPSVE